MTNYKMFNYFLLANTIEPNIIKICKEKDKEYYEIITDFIKQNY
jgi:hypothetical protein